MNSNETHQRFKDADFYNPNLTIVILGLGGIGSFLSHVLCRQGYEMYLYDDDRVEVQNIGSQLYNIKHIGQNKSDVAAGYAAEFGNSRAISMGRFEQDSPVDNIVFTCFDNMKYRKMAFEKWLDHQLSKTPEYRKENPREVNVFIDMRMSAESWQIYMVKSKPEAEKYRLTLFDDSEVGELPCSYKATCQTGMGVATHAASLFLNHVANKKLGVDIRKTYFRTFWDAPLLRLERDV